MKMKHEVYQLIPFEDETLSYSGVISPSQTLNYEFNSGTFSIVYEHNTQFITHVISPTGYNSNKCALERNGFKMDGSNK